VQLRVVVVPFHRRQVLPLLRHRFGLARSHRGGGSGGGGGGGDIDSSGDSGGVSAHAGGVLNGVPAA
jgi:hypothetical protein